MCSFRAILHRVCKWFVVLLTCVSLRFVAGLCSSFVSVGMSLCTRRSQRLDLYRVRGSIMLAMSIVDDSSAVLARSATSA